jgi:hypothetical protein
MTDEIVDALRAMAKRLSDEVSAVGGRARADGLDRPIIGELASALTKRAAARLRALGDGRGGRFACAADRRLAMGATISERKSCARAHVI